MHQKTILRTKLFRPRISNDFVGRVELFKRLNRNAKHRLTMVSVELEGMMLISTHLKRFLEINNGPFRYRSMLVRPLSGRADR